MSKPLWQPAASIENLKKRASILADIRAFFAQRKVWEVETPVLSNASITDVQLAVMETRYVGPGAAQGRRLFLHTSPEFAMKRLLCAGSGDIYQIAKVFRDDEYGRNHNPEFTLLEWYRLGFDHHQLMDEMSDLLQRILKMGVSERQTYGAVFQSHVGENCYEVSVQRLQQLAQERAQYRGEELSRDAALQLLFSICVEPHLGQSVPTFIYDFPASQAALARVRHEQPSVASRFEVYVRGLELANGFHELSNAAEQRQRFVDDNAQRASLGKAQGVIDEQLISALSSGLPDCAGVALGIDRLVMLALGADHIDDVLSFNIANA